MSVCACVRACVRACVCLFVCLRVCLSERERQIQRPTESDRQTDRDTQSDRDKRKTESIPSKSYHRRVGSFLLSFCGVFRALITSLFLTDSFGGGRRGW